MNPDTKRRWVEALRSGEYEQCRGGLRAEGGFCCLGVLCELAVADGVVSRAEVAPGVYEYVSVKDPGDAQGGILPGAVCDWAGLNWRNPEVAGPATAAYLNDTGTTFAEIADLIEVNL